MRSVIVSILALALSGCASLAGLSPRAAEATKDMEIGRRSDESRTYMEQRGFDFVATVQVGAGKAGATHEIATHWKLRALVRQAAFNAAGAAAAAALVYETDKELLLTESGYPFFATNIWADVYRRSD